MNLPNLDEFSSITFYYIPSYNIPYHPVLGLVPIEATIEKKINSNFLCKLLEACGNLLTEVYWSIPLEPLVYETIIEALKTFAERHSLVLSRIINPIWEFWVSYHATNVGGSVKDDFIYIGDGITNETLRITLAVCSIINSGIMKCYEEWYDLAKWSTKEREYRLRKTKRNLYSQLRTHIDPITYPYPSRSTAFYEDAETPLDPHYRMQPRFILPEPGLLTPRIEVPMIATSRSKFEAANRIFAVANQRKDE